MRRISNLKMGLIGVFLLNLVVIHVNAEDSLKSGMNFRKISFKQGLEAAKAEKKPL